MRPSSFFLDTVNGQRTEHDRAAVGCTLVDVESSDKELCRAKGRWHMYARIRVPYTCVLSACVSYSLPLSIYNGLTGVDLHGYPRVNENLRCSYFL